MSLGPPALVFSLERVPAELAGTPPPPVWAEFRSALARFVTEGRASFHRDGVALDVATVDSLAPGDLPGLVVEIHDRDLAQRILAGARLFH